MFFKAVAKNPRDNPIKQLSKNAQLIDSLTSI